MPENERDSYLGVPLKSQTTWRQTTNLPIYTKVKVHGTGPMYWFIFSPYTILINSGVGDRHHQRSPAPRNHFLTQIRRLLHHLSSSCESSTSTVASDLVLGRSFFPTIKKQEESPSENQQKKNENPKLWSLYFSRNWRIDTVDASKIHQLRRALFQYDGFQTCQVLQDLWTNSISSLSAFKCHHANDPGSQRPNEQLQWLLTVNYKPAQTMVLRGKRINA